LLQQDDTFHIPTHDFHQYQLHTAKQLLNYEFNDVLSVVAQEVAIDIRTAKGVRPIRVLNLDSEINGQTVIVTMNQLYSEQEKYVLLEVEIPATKAGKSREIAEVKVSYTNMQTHTTD